MKRLDAVLCLLLAAAGARAQEVKAHEIEPNLHAGNWRVGGSLSLTGDSFSTGSTYSLSANLPLQYFVVDRLAVGGSVNWTTNISSPNNAPSQTTTNVGFGAELSWYFFRSDRFVAFIEPEFFINLHAPDLPTTYQVAGALAVEWFITPSVAAGPGILYAHDFGSSGVLQSVDLYRFFVELSIYL